MDNHHTSKFEKANIRNVPTQKTNLQTRIIR